MLGPPSRCASPSPGRHQRQHVRRPDPAGTASARPSPRRAWPSRVVRARAGGRSGRRACGSSPAPRARARRPAAPRRRRRGLDARHVAVAGQRLARHVEPARELRHRAARAGAGCARCCARPRSARASARAVLRQRRERRVDRVRAAASSQRAKRGSSRCAGRSLTSAHSGPSHCARPGPAPGSRSAGRPPCTRAASAPKHASREPATAERAHDAVADRVDRRAAAPVARRSGAHSARPRVRAPTASGVEQLRAAASRQRSRKSARSSSWMRSMSALAGLVDRQQVVADLARPRARGRSRRRRSSPSIVAVDHARVGGPDAAARRVRRSAGTPRARASRPSACVPSAHDAGSRPSKPTRRGMRPMIVQPMRPLRVGAARGSGAGCPRAARSAAPRRWSRACSIRKRPSVHGLRVVRRTQRERPLAAR